MIKMSCWLIIVDYAKMAISFYYYRNQHFFAAYINYQSLVWGVYKQQN